MVQAPPHDEPHARRAAYELACMVSELVILMLFESSMQAMLGLSYTHIENQLLQQLKEKRNTQSV